jgi:peptide-methionine (S)-S-oxide reductase
MGTRLCVLVGVLTVFTSVSHDPDATAARNGLAKATFAGDCFWSMQAPFDPLDGVRSTTVGYTGGQTVNPTYAEVSDGGTGQAEAVQMVRTPNRISTEQLLEVFWHNIDPTTPNAQFGDHGTQYRTAIFFHDETQRRLAEQAKTTLAEAGKLKARMVTEISSASVFYPAAPSELRQEESHPVRVYRIGCGRDNA